MEKCDLQMKDGDVTIKQMDLTGKVGKLTKNHGDCTLKTKTWDHS